jgi:hypothetical protein
MMYHQRTIDYINEYVRNTIDSDSSRFELLQQLHVDWIRVQTVNLSHVNVRHDHIVSNFVSY